ncbi:nucleoside 2-deoxyribosyltransferase [Aquaspirillum sp. LM1]|uniref:nucleoside 2-deoxyribosyltransferase n=1 Tax=Aquaspirillum sp. LM1 TaxID=1938604 RepID=UPI0012377CB3|nr:nucleoside 2-deoxyribosyltransferase [Aquaspirillum sp. LM1]
MTTQSIPCPVCDSNAEKIHRTDGFDGLTVDCPHCGSFSLCGSLVSTWPSQKANDPLAAAKLSHAVRNAQTKNAITIVNTDMCNAILRTSLPKPREQADLMIRWLAENYQEPGKEINLNYADHGAIIGSQSATGFVFTIDYMMQSGFLEGKVSKVMDASRRQYHLFLTVKGWDCYDEIKTRNESYRKAFMAMKFGDGCLDQTLENVFKPAAKKAGFELFKSTELLEAGLIDNQIRAQIQASDFVIADLSHDNLGAYWEAGYAEGLGKPVIYTCQKSKFEKSKTHFDTNHHLTIVWDDENPAQCERELIAAIRVTLPHIAKMDD